MSERVLLITVMLVCLAGTASAQTLRFIKMSNDKATSLFDKRAVIARHGGRIIHEFPPNEFICEIDSTQFEFLSDRFAVTGGGHRKSADNSLARYCYEKLLDRRSNKNARVQFDEDSLPEFKCGTSYSTPDNQDKPAVPSQALSISRTKMFNANYLVGQTAVCVVLPEGPSGNLDWTSQDEWDAVSEIIEAYDKLSLDAASYNVDVTWVYEIHYAVPVSEEPIEYMRPTFHQNPLNWWTFGWIDEVNSYLGVANEWDGLFDNANRMRQQYQTDWGITFFIAKNAPGQSFPGNAIGYTKYYWMELTNDNFRAPFAVSGLYYGYSSEPIDRTMAHETLHIFGASDEYGTADLCNEASDCYDLYGFLQVDNQNCEQCTPEPATCIMRGSIQGYYYCQNTLAHVGWSDSDSDSHPDAIDLNNNIWTYFVDIQPGDIVYLSTLSGETVRNIAVTANKMDQTSSGSGLYFDCANYESQQLMGGIYYLSLNGGAPDSWVPEVTNPYIIPLVHTITYDEPTGLLSWELQNSFAYLNLNISRVDEQTGDTLLLARRLWNKFNFTSTYSETKITDVANIYCDPCIARFNAWRPDGNVNAETVQFVYSNPYSCCGEFTGGFTGNTDCDLDGRRNLNDINRLTDFIYGSHDPLCCHDNGNVDGSLNGAINLADINRLIDHVYISKAQTAACN